VARFDKGGDHFYDLISAVHKSIRGSAPDAALYWYARMVSAGCDPLHRPPLAGDCLGRRGQRRSPCHAGGALGLGLLPSHRPGGRGAGHRPGHRLPRLRPKSNAVYTAWKAALHDAKNLPDFEVPPHLRNAPTKLMSELGYGAEYRYAHDEPGAYAAGEQYFLRACRQAVLSTHRAGLRSR
jgi:putative ATPase